MIAQRFLIAFSAFAFAFVPGVAQAERPAHRSPALVNQGSQQPAPAPERNASADAERYAELESENPELEEFKGGDRIVISMGLGAAVVVLLIVVILL